MKTIYKLLFAMVVLCGGLYAAYRLGRHEERKITWLSELLQRTRGTKGYFVDVQIVCSNGKVLGPLQVDLNLSNGRFRIVRNDAGLEPSCDK